MAERECAHVQRLRELAYEHGVDIYSEHGEQPRGWVNAHCTQCRRTYEVRPFRTNELSGTSPQSGTATEEK